VEKTQTYSNFFGSLSKKLFANIIIWSSLLLGLQIVGCKTSDADNVRIGGLPLYSAQIQSRQISAENKTGAKGQGGKTSNDCRKYSPCIRNFKAGDSYTFAEMEGPGVIRHIWITFNFRTPMALRNLILRFYWDDQKVPSVEAPLSDFFGMPHGAANQPLESEFLIIADGTGYNCYFPMPFRKKAKLVVCNESNEDIRAFFYEFDYTLGDDITEDTPYFHAQFRRVLKTTLRNDYVILDDVKGKGRFLGANIGIINRFSDFSQTIWWGEGEVKMYIDGDDKYPTICGTGTEDYAGSAYKLEQGCSRYFGAPFMRDQFISFYRFHVLDPIYFSEDIKVTIQQLGASMNKIDPNGPLRDFFANGLIAKDSRGYLEWVQDVCSTAYWYQTLPTMPFQSFPDRKTRSIDIVGVAPVPECEESAQQAGNERQAPAIVNY